MNKPIAYIMKDIFDNLDELMEKYMNDRGGYANQFQGAFLSKDEIIISNIINKIDGGHGFKIKKNENTDKGMIQPGTLPKDCSIAQGFAGMIIQILNDPKAEPEQQWSSVWKGYVERTDLWKI